MRVPCKYYIPYISGFSLIKLLEWNGGRRGAWGDSGKGMDGNRGNAKRTFVPEFRGIRTRAHDCEIGRGEKRSRCYFCGHFSRYVGVRGKERDCLIQI